MSDLDGERAFDLITERMLDLNTRLDAVSRERDEARGAGRLDAARWRGMGKIERWAEAKEQADGR